MNIIVRRATKADSERACDVVRASITESCVEDHLRNPEILCAWLKNKTPENLRRWIEGDAYAIVADRGGEIIGTAMLKPDGMILLCYVTPEARFAGAGTAMLRALENEAARTGVKKLVLASTKTAFTFYSRMGFFPTGEVEATLGMQAPCMEKLINATEPA